MLLVLDNFEHLLEAGATLIELLTLCPQLTILVTSRSVLSVSGEHVLQVPPLEWRQVDGIKGAHPADTGEAELLDAERLFVERASAVDPTFATRYGQDRSIAEICARLDGLPLAIEMAAARSHLLAPEEMIERLDQRLPMLTAGARDLPARQRTMSDAIAWSYDLLDLEEQRVLRRLAVFVGAWSIQAAADVCWDLEIDESQRFSAVLPVIDSLVRKSLVTREPATQNVGPGVGQCFRLLEVIREFAEVELFKSSELEATRERHAMYYASAAARLEPMVWGDKHGDVHTIIAAELGNYRAAFDWALRKEHSEAALRLAGAIYDPEGEQGTARLLGQGTFDQLTLVERALALPGGSNEARALALFKACHLAVDHRDRERAVQLADEALEYARRTNNALISANAAYFRGRTAFRAGDLDDARTWLELASIEFQKEGILSRFAWAQCILATIECCVVPPGGAGDHPELVRAGQRCDSALQAFQEVGHKSGVSRALSGKVYVAYKQGDWMLALSLSRDLLVTAMAEGRVALNRIEDVADIAGRMGEPGLAARLYGAIEADRRGLGEVPVSAFHSEIEAEHAFVRRTLGDTSYAREFAMGESMPIDWAMSEAFEYVSRALAPTPVQLTSREEDVLPLLAEDATAQEIADQLFLSRRTVETHIGKPLRQVGRP
ncbi:MAG: LuxR C-terminal-related transcriptional regulator [Thermomicrobiales bacterium]